MLRIALIVALFGSAMGQSTCTKTLANAARINGGLGQPPIASAATTDCSVATVTTADAVTDIDRTCTAADFVCDTANDDAKHVWGAAADTGSLKCDASASETTDWAALVSAKAYCYNMCGAVTAGSTLGDTAEASGACAKGEISTGCTGVCPSGKILHPASDATKLAKAGLCAVTAVTSGASTEARVDDGFACEDAPTCVDNCEDSGKIASGFYCTDAAKTYSYASGVFTTAAVSNVKLIPDNAFMHKGVMYTTTGNMLKRWVANSATGVKVQTYIGSTGVYGFPAGAAYLVSNGDIAYFYNGNVLYSADMTGTPIKILEYAGSLGAAPLGAEMDGNKIVYVVAASTAIRSTVPDATALTQTVVADTGRALSAAISGVVSDGTSLYAASATKLNKMATLAGTSGTVTPETDVSSPATGTQVALTGLGTCMTLTALSATQKTVCSSTSKCVPAYCPLNLRTGVEVAATELAENLSVLDSTGAYLHYNATNYGVNVTCKTDYAPKPLTADQYAYTYQAWCMDGTGVINQNDYTHNLTCVKTCSTMNMTAEAFLASGYTVTNATGACSLSQLVSAATNSSVMPGTICAVDCAEGYTAKVATATKVISCDGNTAGTTATVTLPGLVCEKNSAGVAGFAMAVVVAAFAALF